MILTINNLWLKRGNQTLLKHFNLNLNTEQIWLLKGHNGVGKSSLLKAIAGLLTPYRGDINWSTEAQISFLDHKDGINLHLTPLENIQKRCMLADTLYDKQRTLRLLEQYQLQRAANHLCRTLSQGQRRIVALIAVMMTQNKIWLLDEPFNVLDQQAISTTCQMLRSQQQQGGLIIMTSHHVDNYGFTAIQLPQQAVVC